MDANEISAIGYPAVRKAFNETLQLCAEKLSNADWALAQDILGLTAHDGGAPGLMEMLADTALFSRKGKPGTRRAIDRIAPKVAVKRDPLRSLIAMRLPTAVFSILAIDEPHEQGGVLARDLLDDGRIIHVMDSALAVQAAQWDDVVIAGRFVDLGPWHVGFGIVLPLRKSETMAVSLAMSNAEDIGASRDSLHELFYPAHLHGDDLVMAALEPLIAAFAAAIDADMIDIDDLTASIGSLLSGKAPPRPKRKGGSR
ncbi:hypothetical protein [Novosphingobium colocasiae]|nr:hypothetical protein [Novosphingobium colocasiae]